MFELLKVYGFFPIVLYVMNSEVELGIMFELMLTKDLGEVAMDEVTTTFFVQ